jgi:hypothetical protein
VFEYLPFTNARSHWMLITARLRPGVTPAQAQAEMEALSAAFYERYPIAGRTFSPIVLPTQQARFWPGHRSSLINYIALLATVAAMTLLMACFNVANLLLGGAAGRQREFGIQMAIGAGRLRLAGALLMEAALVAFFGPAAGLGLASLEPVVLQQFRNPFGIPLDLSLSLDARVIAFALALALVATLLVGLSPSRLAWRTDVNSLNKAEATAGRTHGFRLIDALVVAQIAISLTALAGAALFLRTLQHAQGPTRCYASAMPFW